MITLPVKDTNGDEVGSYKLDPDDFALHVNKQLLHDVVVMYEANQRQGASKTKSRGEVRGSTRKLYRQKGTGRARAGMRRSPVRRGGGHTFAKRPKDWSYRLPKKAIRTATRQALLSKFRDDEVTLLQDFVISEPRTRHVAAVLAALENSPRPPACWRFLLTTATSGGPLEIFPTCGSRPPPISTPTSCSTRSSWC
ncbi:MAG: hypothetical protein CM1200mP2_00410 [Planctomycetaceae bacterium]|nr:MAG: hypothetical protein CM1200mP2_00410 [Planctomycetaceae bacterium]